MGQEWAGLWWIGRGTGIVYLPMYMHVPSVHPQRRIHTQTHIPLPINRLTDQSIQTPHEQVVRYWGPVPELGEGDWVGVELENPVGDADGSYAGKVRHLGHSVA